MRRRAIFRTFGLGVLGVATSAFAFSRYSLDQGASTSATESSALAASETGSPALSLSTPAAAALAPTSAPIRTATSAPSNLRRAATAPTSPTSAATSTAAPTPAPDASAGGDIPQFSNVTERTPADGVKFLRGQLRQYPGSSAASVFGFSSSDILETLDTSIVDRVRATHGETGLNRVYDTIALQILETLRDLYGDAWVVVPLDAGHGGDRAEFWDSGANGTEALYTRGVAASVLALAKTEPYSRFTVIPIFNDGIPDFFGIPGKENEPLVNQTVMRQIRAAMLAFEAGLWNRNHPDPSSQVVVHEISVHFNSGVGGALVLRQGDTVSEQFRQQSINYGQRYLQRVLPALNATGVLPSVLRLFGATGMHDDVMMYTPGGQITDDNGRPIVLRYGMLQGGGFGVVYVQKILKYA